MRRVAGFSSCAIAVAVVARTLAYALAGTERANDFNAVTGGPRLVTVAIVSFGLALGVAAAALWLAVQGVRERDRLRPDRIVPRLSPRRLAANGVWLFLTSCVVFAAFESYVHARAGLGVHGLSCLTAPQHRNALPILGALSIVAAAVGAAVGHVLSWMRAAVRLLRSRPRRLYSALPRRRSPAHRDAPSPARADLSAQPRAPPSVVLAT
jgi:hypothetical protein